MTSLAHYRFFCIFAAHIHNKEQMETVIEFLKDLLGSNAFIDGVVCVFIVFAAWWARGIKEKITFAVLGSNSYHPFGWLFALFVAIC